MSAGQAGCSARRLCRSVKTRCIPLRRCAPAGRLVHAPGQFARFSQARRVLGVLASFVMSGLLHEMLYWCAPGTAASWLACLLPQWLRQWETRCAALPLPQSDRRRTAGLQVPHPALHPPPALVLAFYSLGAHLHRRERGQEGGQVRQKLPALRSASKRQRLADHAHGVLMQEAGHRGAQARGNGAVPDHA